MAKCEHCWGRGIKPNNTLLGRLARRRREFSKISLSSAARRLGITASHLCYLEQGKRGWSEALWRKAMKP